MAKIDFNDAGTVVIIGSGATISCNLDPHTLARVGRTAQIAVPEEFEIVRDPNRG